MRIVSWNCGGKFREKFDHISALDADVYVIQECESPKNSSPCYQEWAQNYVWIQSTMHKGIGVFVKNGLGVRQLDWPDYHLEKFLPVQISNGIKILAVWTKYARKMRYIGQFWQYLQHNSAYFDDKTVICGDFNSNAIWDKKRREWNHSSCVSKLAEIGFQSAYHHLSGDCPGMEKQPTFHLHRNNEKPYHIDYFFAHRRIFEGSSTRILVGSASEWLSFSDHVPVTLEF